MPQRSDSPVTLPDAYIPYRLGDLNNHPDYPAAKAGDFAAAHRIAVEMMTATIAHQLLTLYPSTTTLLPVLAQEAQGRNKIPLALALQLEHLTGIPVELDIGQRTKVSRTALNGLDRIFAVPEFAGEVKLGENYLLLDDTLTQGGTFAALASYVEQKGAHAVGVCALTGKQYSAKLTLDLTLLTELRTHYGDIEPDFTEATGYSFNALTQSEARTLIHYRPTEQVRIRIYDERNARRRSTESYSF